MIDSRYKITGFLGTGGMGSVYRAEHMIIRRPVAVKLLHKDLVEDPSFAARFEREAFAIGRVAHPNCVTVSDFGKLEDGSLYLVMELLAGSILGDVLADERRLEPRRALHIARHVLRGLGHAHKSGIVHRDVKPDNVILVQHDDDPDFAKVLDFGIAKLVGDAPAAEGQNQLTRVGTTVGTPTYVAPEQAFGQAVDSRADLYSLSVMLFEMIAGEPPYQSPDTLKVLSMHVGAPIPRIQDRAPGVEVPEMVEALVERGMAKDRAGRYADAEEYVAAIDAAIESLDAGAVHTPPPELHTPRPEFHTPPPGYHTPPPGYHTPPPGHHTPPPGSMTPLPGSLGTASPHRPAITGTELTALPAARRRRLYAAAGGGAALLLVVVLIAAGGSEQSDAPPTVKGPLPGKLVKQALPKGPSDLSREAERMLERGEPRAVIELLESRAREVAYDAHAQLQLGHAYAAVGRGKDASAAYTRAIDLDRKLGADARLRANTRAAMDAPEIEVVLAALELGAVVAGDDEVQNRLVELASGAQRPVLRQSARDLAERAGLRDKLDLVQSYAMDLQQGRSCEERRPAVARLRSLEDPRAIRPLRRALQRRTGGILGIGARNANACLRDEAQEAITYLEKL